MRKIIQFQNTLIEGVEYEDAENIATAALCDDGSMWMFHPLTNSEWVPYPSIPQDKLNVRKD